VANITVTGSGNPVDVAAMGATAYVGNFSTSTLQAYNVSNPATPALLSTISNSSRVRRVLAAGSMVYVTGFGIGTNTISYLQAYDTSNPAAPVTGRVIQAPAPPIIVGASSTTVCVANTTTPAMLVFDAALNLLSTVTTASVVTNLAVKGTTAYVQRVGACDIYDLSTPTAPVLRSTVSAHISVISGNLAFGLANVASQTRLHIYDISNPLIPVLLSSIANNGGGLLAVGGNTVFTTGQYITIGGSTAPLQAFDITTPTAPVLRATAGAGSTATALAASNNAAYLVNSDNNTLQVYAVTGALAKTGSTSPATLALYPNPAHSLLTVAGSSTASPITVYEPTGRICFTAVPSAAGTIDIQALRPGIYIARMGYAVSKFVVE
jgi:hypothetical protein